MKIHLAARMSAIRPSASMAARQRVVALQAAGKRVIDLTIGEPDLDTPFHVAEAAVAAIRAGDTHYTATAGTPVLRAAICTRLHRDHGLEVTPAEVVVGAGAKQLIHEALAATLDAGDEVIVPAPYWVSYPEIATLYGGNPVIVPCLEEGGFKLTPSALEAAIGERTRWLILNAPNNPTGALYSAEELSALAEVLRRHPNVLVMTDDIYNHLVYDGMSAPLLASVAPDLRPRMLIVNGISKAYSMTGWRIGYAFGPATLITAMTTLIGQGTSCASSVSQAAATAALSGDQTCVDEAVKVFARRRDVMFDLLNGTPGLRVSKPQGAFYFYPSVEGLIGKRTPDGKVIGSDTDLAVYLLEAAGVAVLDGAAYGMSPYLRLSFGGPVEAIKDGCRVLREACEALS